MSTVQWLLAGAAVALALILGALVSTQTAAPVVAERREVLRPIAPAPLPTAPRAPPSPPVPSVTELIARAMVALGDKGGALDRYCAASHELESVPLGRPPNPTVARAWARVEAVGRLALREQRADRGDRALVCRDGQLSPTCTCNGPRRGCCSWHGGVRGCEPLPDRVLCPMRLTAPAR